MSGAARALRLFAGAWVLILFGLFLADISVISLNLFLSWLPVSMVSAAVGAFSAVIGAQAISALTIPMDLGRALIAALITGLVVGISQVLFGSLIGAAVPWEPALVISSATLTIGVIGTGAILFSQTTSDLVAQRADLLSDSLTVTETRGDVAEIATRMRELLTHDIDAALSPARLSIEERLRDQSRLLDDDDWKLTAVELRAAASETIGPLSRRLWAPNLPEETRITIWSIIRNVITQQPFQPRAMALIVLVTFFPSQVATLGWIYGLISVIVGMATIWILLSLANMAMRHWPAHHALIFLVTIFGVQAGHLLTYYFRSLVGGSPYTLVEFIGAAVIGVILIFITSAFGSLRSYRADVARTIAVENDREFASSVAASRQVAQLARESARILHGTVQTRLIACAVAIERAADTRDVDAFHGALREAHNVLANPALENSADDATVLTEVDRKIGLWSGLCEIDVSIDPTVTARTGRLARDIGRVVEEGVSNAIRHGGADAISIQIRESADGILVEVRDNGCGPTGGVPGLGSSLLDSVSSCWILETVDHSVQEQSNVLSASTSATGARLRVTVPG